jgi:hypothetical protein
MPKKHQKTGLKELPNEKGHGSHEASHAQGHGAQGHTRSAHVSHADQKAVFQWIAPEYIRHEKSKNWYFGATLVLVATILLAYYTANWSMALAVLVFAGVYLFTHQYHPPKDVHVVISDLGIRMGHMFFFYSDIKAFWIIYKPDWKTLNLRVSKHWFSEISIHLNGMDPVEIRHYLVGQVPEWEGKDEKFGDIILRLLKL